MKFSFMKKIEGQEKVKLKPGDIVEFLGEVCLVTSNGVISLQVPNRAWSPLEEVERHLEKVPPGSIVTLTQE